MADKDAADQNFNDSELQDIMNEIENLEKEFTEDSGPAETLEATADTPAEETPEASDPVLEASSEEIEASSEEVEAPIEEIEASSDEVEDLADDDIVSESDIENISEEMVIAEQAEAQAEVETEEQEQTAAILPLTGARNENITNTTPGEMSFNGSGQLNFELTFNIGGQKANLKVLDGVGVNVSLNDTELSIDDNGLSIKMENGTNFNVPFSDEQASKNKKAA